MSNHPGSLSNTQLLAYVSDGESAAAIRALMHRQNVRDFAVEPGNVVEATEYLKSHASPQVLIVEVTSADDAPRQLDALADVVNPATKVIVTGRVDTFSFYHWLLGLGIHDYLLSPFNEQQLASALEKGNAPKASAAPEKQATQLIAVMGARGGVGATMVAITLASIYAKEHQQLTALVDLDPHFGSVALSLDLEPSRGLRDALEKPDRVDTLFLERVMIKPYPQLSILSAEDPLSEIIQPHSNAGEAMLGSLREKFSTIVIDLPRQVNPLMRQVLAQADHVVLVAEPTLLSLRDTLRLKDFVTETLKRPVPHLVVNREGLAAKQELSRADFAKHTGIGAAAHLPYQAEVAAAMARGEHVLEDAKLHGVADPLRKLVAQWAGGEASSKQAAKRGLFKGRK